VANTEHKSSLIGNKIGEGISGRYTFVVTPVKTNAFVVCGVSYSSGWHEQLRLESRGQDRGVGLDCTCEQHHNHAHRRVDVDDQGLDWKVRAARCRDGA